MLRICLSRSKNALKKLGAIDPGLLQFFPMVISGFELACEMVRLEHLVESITNLSTLFRIDSKSVLSFGDRHTPLKRAHTLCDVGANNIKRQSFALKINVIAPKHALKVGCLLDQSVFCSLPPLRTGNRLFDETAFFTNTLESLSNVTVESAVETKESLTLVDGGFRRKAGWTGWISR